MSRDGHVGEGYTGPLLVTAHLASPLAGDAPHLDALLEWALSLHHPKGIPGYKIDRARPAPPPGQVPIPVPRQWLGVYLVARCSAPILPVPAAEDNEYVCKRIGVEHAILLDPRARLVVSTTNSWTKSYRLPLRIRVLDRVRWFAAGNRHAVLSLLRREVKAIGKKVADGYGRVSWWEVEPAVADYSWFAPSPAGEVLMRPLPLGPWLPENLVGARRDYGACSPPYWHPDRYGEIIVPC